MNSPPQEHEPVATGTIEAKLIGEQSLGLVHVTQSLHRQFDQRLGSDLVDNQIRFIAAKFTDAPVRIFVPLLVRRYATEALETDCREINPGDRGENPQ